MEVLDIQCAATHLPTPTCEITSIDVYEGDWMSDKRQGKGTLTRLDQSRLDAELVGSVYVGEWQDDKISG